MKYDYGGGISPHYSCDRLDADGSQLLLSSEDSYGRMFVNETGNYKAIASSIVLGAMANGDSLNLKTYLISEIVNYFLGYNPVTDLQENIQFLSEVNSYPNPFTSNTNISYTLNKAGNVTINIFDLNGQLVKSILKFNQQPGSHRIQWDATNIQGNLVESGYYFCKITNNEKTYIQKLIYLR